MNQRIFRSMCLLVVFTVLFFALLWGLLFATQWGEQVQTGLKTLRVSVIDPSGDVMFDNMADPQQMNNHLDRPEVAEALEKGSGESKRYSDTLREATWYYAVRLNGGDILRLSLTTDSASAILYRFIPLVLFCLVLAAAFAFVIARRLTRRIIAPINNMDLDAPELVDYEELLPFLKKIETQKRELSAQHWELENRAATITAIGENMREGLLLLDQKGTVVLANESIGRIFGIGEVIGKKVIEVCRDLRFLDQVKVCLLGEKTEMVLHAKSCIYNVFLNPVFDGPISSGAVVLFIDITQRYAAEAQRKEFTANVSHELKTPLTTIAGLSEMIADGTAREKDIRSFADKIKMQANRLIAMIEDIIRLSQFDEGGAPREWTAFNLYDVAEAVIESLREKAMGRHVTVELAGDSELFLTAHRGMMDELLYNLVDNAIKYNKEGGSVKVSLSEQGEYAKITVADTGIGISQEHMSRIFERFYRVDKSRSKKTGGTGLGLSIVKHIAEYHGGYIRVESGGPGGAGTTFDCFVKMKHPVAIKVSRKADEKGPELPPTTQI